MRSTSPAATEPLPHVMNNSGNAEWHTPAEVVAVVRRVLVRIDLDPASNPLAQRTVRARRFYTEADDGLSQPWYGRIFLNPPYGRRVVRAFVDRLVEEFNRGSVTEASRAGQ